MKFLKSFKYICEILKEKNLNDFIFLIFLFIFVSIVDIFGIASIIPFVYSIINKDTLLNNSLLNYLYNLLNFSDINEFQTFIFFCFSFLIIFSIILRGLTIYIQYKFALFKEYSISSRLLNNYINQDYLWFISQNSSILIKNLISEVSTVVNIGINNYINLISQFFIIISIIILLLFINYKVFFFSFFILIILYLILFKLFSKILTNYGNKRFDYNESRFYILDQFFNSIREIKIFNLSRNYLNHFNSENLKYVRTNLFSSIIAVLPKYFFELIIFFSFFIYIFLSLKKNFQFLELIPQIALYFFALFRLMPAFQSFYNSLSKIRFVDKSIKKMYEEIIKTKEKSFYKDNISEKKKVNFKKFIRFENVEFKYPLSKKENIKNISLKFLKGTKIGIIGKTGSGKTTFVNLIIGLLKPTKGKIFIDEKELNSLNFNSFRELIGYVPQNTILIDDTVAANISLSDKYNEPDYEKIKEASKKAEILEFIYAELPNGFETKIGQNGVNLSGGQRQRIGIARALYNNPDLIFFDEATNALDKMTEKKIFENIIRIKNITLICVSHDVNLFKDFDSILLLEKGKVGGKKK
jgi:ABC-type multidrug transport system fused ATPase/permease subunit